MGDPNERRLIRYREPSLLNYFPSSKRAQYAMPVVAAILNAGRQEFINRANNAWQNFQPWGGFSDPDLRRVWDWAKNVGRSNVSYNSGRVSSSGYSPYRFKQRRYRGRYSRSYKGRSRRFRRYA